MPRRDTRGANRGYCCEWELVTLPPTGPPSRPGGSADQSRRALDVADAGLRKQPHHGKRGDRPEWQLDVRAAGGRELRSRNTR